MISLRAKPGVAGLDAAIRAVTGTGVPAQRRIEVAGDCAAAWMSPDEYLLILPYGDTGAALEKIAAALAGQHHLAAVVSDARAVFRIEGDRADQVIRKLCPVDMDRFEPGRSGGPAPHRWPPRSGGRGTGSRWSVLGPSRPM